jgi:DNA (cytosine-5)-methyltransferase 1
MLKVIDLFAGAGGFGYGFQLADYSICCSIEIDHWAADTLRENKPISSIVIEDNIRNYQSERDISDACGGITPDVIIGGPPCQGFSVAGSALRKDPKDPRNSLFKDFARWVKYLQPSIFIMENVKGILTQRNVNREKVIDIIEKTFLDIGYPIEIWILNAAEYGVPQFRERVFLVGNRLGKVFGRPARTHLLNVSGKNKKEIFSETKNEPPAISVWDAISDLPVIAAGEGKECQLYTKKPENEYQKLMRGSQEVLYNHVAMKHSLRMVERFKQIQWKQSVSHVSEEYRARKRNGNGESSNIVYSSNNRRMHPFHPSYTIPAQFYSSFIHPYEHRNITAREAARLQSFPDSYRFKGERTVISSKLLKQFGRSHKNYLSQYNQVGNAVPPLLAKAIASHIRFFFE